jgi:UDP-N-acetyl-alpha-D-quinovosamine dehydrogenase
LTALTARDETQVVAAIRRAAPLPAGVKQVRVDDLGPGAVWTPALSGCDAVVHLAARVHVMADRTANPLAEFRTTNVEGTIAIAEQAAAAGVRRFVFMSSIKVNGESSLPGRPFTPSDRVAPIDPYGISKAEAEDGLFAVGQRSGMEIVIIRSPLVYGPGVQANFLSMMRWIARGVPLPLGALSDNRRSLVGLDNLVDLVVTCIGHPSAANEVFMTSDGEDLSTAELLRRAGNALGVRVRLFPLPASMLTMGAALIGQRAMMQRLSGSLQVDISKTRRLLGWNPPFNVDEELRRTVTPFHTASRVV